MKYRYTFDSTTGPVSITITAESETEAWKIMDGIVKVEEFELVKREEQYE